MWYKVRRYTEKEISEINPVEFWCKQFEEHSMMIEFGLVSGQSEIDNIIENSKYWADYWGNVNYNDLDSIRDLVSLWMKRL